MPYPVKVQATVSKVIMLGGGVYEVHFAMDHVPRFKSGQFLHLALDEFDPCGGFWPESRVFSIAPSIDGDGVSIIYSVKGRFTRCMESTLAIGSRVWLKLPYGDFIIDLGDIADRDLVLVAGGTGISPYLGYLEGLASGAAFAASTRLYFGVRNAKLIHRAELLGMCRDSGRLDLTLYLEDGSLPGPPLAGVRAISGRLDIASISKDDPSSRDAVYFLSGPPAMISAFRNYLILGGVSEASVRIDNWE